MANKPTEKVRRISLADKNYNWRARLYELYKADLDETLEIERRV